MALTDRVKSFFGMEGSQRGPFFGQGEQGSWFELGSREDGFQRNLNVDRFTMDRIPAISGAKHLYRSAFAQLRGDHHRFDASGAVDTVASSAAGRLLITPNAYETAPEFNARLVDEWITSGEVVVLARRNNRFEAESLHILPRGTWQLYIDPDTKTNYYFVSDDTTQVLTPTNAQMAIPARDVLHLRWATHRSNPLIGVSPLLAAGAAAGIHTALTASQTAFFSQMRRPSGVLQTDMKLSPDQIKVLREAWDDQSKALNQGGLPILSSGLKFESMALSSADAEVIASLKMSNDEIFRALGVPPPLLGALENATLANVEQLVAAWLSFSLGGLIEKYERGLDRLFGFDSRKNRVEFDVSILLRSDMSARTDSYSKMINAGIATPNEIRRKEGLGSVEGGDHLFLQRQMTPVSLINDLNAAELENKLNPPAPEPQLPPAEPEEEEPKPTEEDVKAIALAAIKKAMEA